MNYIHHLLIQHLRQFDEELQCNHCYLNYFGFYSSFWWIIFYLHSNHIIHSNFLSFGSMNFMFSFSLNPHHPLKFSLCWQYDGFVSIFLHHIHQIHINLTEIFTLSPVIFLFFFIFYTIFTKSTSVSLKCSLFRQHIYFLFFCIIFTKSTPVLLKFSLFR